MNHHPYPIPLPARVRDEMIEAARRVDHDIWILLQFNPGEFSFVIEYDDIIVVTWCHRRFSRSIQERFVGKRFTMRPGWSKTMYRSHMKPFITFQALWRGYILRKRRQQAITLVTKAQAIYRGYIGRKHYQQTIAAITIQNNFWRDMVVTRVRRRNFDDARLYRRRLEGIGRQRQQEQEQRNVRAVLLDELLRSLTTYVAILQIVLMVVSHHFK